MNDFIVKTVIDTGPPKPVEMSEVKRGRGGRMTNQEWLAKQIGELTPEEVYDLIYDIVINIGSRYNTSRGGVADWLMRDAILDEVTE